MTWMEKLNIPYDRAEELFAGLNRLVLIRNQVAHARKVPFSKEVSQAIVVACTLLDAAISSVIPSAGAGEKEPYLLFDEHRALWRLLRPLQGEDRYEVYDSRWHRRFDLEETAGAIQAGKAAMAAMARTQTLSE